MKNKEKDQKIHLVEDDEYKMEEDCDCKNEKCDQNEHCDCENDKSCKCDCENGTCTCEDCKCKQQADEYLNLLKVVQADFENYRKRSISQTEKARTDGIAHTVELFLPSLDAFKNAKQSIKDETTLKGIEMLEKQIRSNLTKLGVEKIEAIGKPLDPNLHNAVAVGKDESKEDGIILEEFQAGYRLGDKIIRYSQVLVNKL